MNRSASLSIASLVAATGLSACGGSAGAPAAPVAPATAASQSNATQALFTFSIPAKSAAKAARRSRSFVSAETTGVSISALSTGDAYPVVTNYDVSSSSPSCKSSTTEGNALDCSLFIPARPGSDTFTVTTYTTTPTQGFTAAGAISTGSANATIVSGQTNSVAVVLSDIVRSVGFDPPRVTLSGSQATSTSVVAYPIDATGYTEGQVSTTPYQNPIRLSIVESGNGGANHASLSVNGGFPVGFVTLKSPADEANITLNYDGMGSPGYVATVVATIPAVSTAPVGSGQFDPLFISSSSPLYSGGQLDFTAAGQSAAFTVVYGDAGDPMFPTTLSVQNIGPGDCSTGIASATGPSAIAASPATFTISAGTSAGSCNYAVETSESFTLANEGTFGITYGIKIPINSTI